MPFVSPATGPVARVLGFFARRQYGPAIDESTAVYARHVPLVLGFARFNRTVERPGRLGRTLKDLASVRAAAIAECEFCIDIGSEYARRSGLSDEQLLALPRAEASGLFTEEQLVVIAYAEATSRTPAVVDDALAARARRRFDERQLVELAFICAWENARARLNVGLGIGVSAGGFSEGRVCARPDSAAEASPVPNAA